MATDGGTCVPRADPLAVVRHWEAEQGRALVDPALAAWRDLDSEVVLLARRRWRVRLPSGTAYWARRRYLSFDRSGAPQRLIDLRLLSAAQDTLSTRHSDLLVAAGLGSRYWIYTLAPQLGGDLRLTTIQDPARLAWDPARRWGGGGGVDDDPPWLLPLSRVSSPSVLLAAS